MATFMPAQTLFKFSNPNVWLPEEVRQAFEMFLTCDFTILHKLILDQLGLIQWASSGLVYPFSLGLLVRMRIGNIGLFYSSFLKPVLYLP